jgi:transcriptional regulator with XRE-family HTH domain
MQVVKQPTHVDKQVAGRIRERRVYIGMSQERLADALGVTFQQVQKYEKGTNRISVSRLVVIAAARGTTANELLGDAGQGEHAPFQPDPVADTLRSSTGLRLAEAFVQLPPGPARTALANLVERTLAVHRGLQNG